MSFFRFLLIVICHLSFVIAILSKNAYIYINRTMQLPA